MSHMRGSLDDFVTHIASGLTPTHANGVLSVERSRVLGQRLSELWSARSRAVLEIRGYRLTNG